MRLRKPDTKNIVMLTTLISSVLLFFNFFLISIPLLESFLESSSFSISFFTLPGFIEKNAIGLITRLAGKGASVTLLMVCAFLKYICLLSSFFGIYGAVRLWFDRENTKFIFTSQLIVFAMCVLSFLLIITVNVFIFRYSSFLTEAMNLEETLELNFLPTVWLFITSVTSLISLVGIIKIQKQIQ